ncbi:hypothetical protein ABZ917_17405 [Nonomuraea wenchangensis]
MPDPMQTPRLAKLVRLERIGRSFKLEIDGEVFPYHLSGDEPIVTTLESSNMATVRFTLMAERLELVDDLFGGADA